MTCKRLIITLLIFIVASSVFGQDHFIRHWTKKDGLAHNYIFLMKEYNDKMYIGTDDGLSIFDGKSFKNYSSKKGLRSPYVIGFNENYSDSLYLFTWRGGVHVFDETADSIKTYPYLQKDRAKRLHRGLRINNDYYGWQWSSAFYFNDKTRESHDLFIYSQDSALVLDIDFNKQKKPIIKNDDYMPIGFARYQNKMLIYGCASKGLNVIEKTTLTGKFFEKSLGDKIISGFNKTKDGGALVSTLGKIYQLTPKGEIINQFELPEGFYSPKMYQLSNGNIAAEISQNKNSQKCIIIDQNTNKIISLDKIIRTKSATSGLLVDSKDRIWVSTQGDGLFMIENYDINYIDIEDIGNPHILSLGQIDSTEIVFSTPDKSYSLNILNNDISIFKNIPITDVNYIPEDTLQIFSTYEYTFTNKNKNIPISWGKYVGKNKGGLWFTEEDSLKVVDINDEGKYELKKVFWRFPQGVIEIPRISNSIILDSAIWMATKGAISLYEYSGNYKLTLLKTWGHTFADWEWVNDINIDKANGYLWIASSNGLYVINLKDPTNASIKKIKSLEGINCISLTFDHLGQLWVGTTSGLAVFKDGILKRRFNESSGLLADQVNHVFESSNNRLYIGTHRGMVNMDNSNLVSAILPPSIKWKYSTYNSHSRDGVVRLPINIGVLSEMESLQLQYKLSQSSDWINFTYQKALAISNHSPGTYKLFIRGRTIGSEWSVPEIASLVIDGYFWEYPLFKGGLIVLILISIIYYSNILIKKERIKANELKEVLHQKTLAQEKLTRVRKEIAQDFHDEMGNKLASITVLADLASMKIKGKDDDTEKILGRIENQSKLLYTGTRDFIWSIDAQNDELGVIYDYIKDFGEEFFDNLEIRYHTLKDIKHLETLTLPQSWSLQLVFIFKEAMTNIAKYAQATHVYLSLVANKEYITFSIRDNGVGISNTQIVKNGNGLKNMQSRINKLENATLNIESQEGEGTAIIVQFNTDFNK